MDVSQKIIDAYYSKDIGIPSARNIYAKINAPSKIATLKQINEVLAQLKDRPTAKKVQPYKDRLF